MNNEERIIEKLLEHDEKIAQLVTREEFSVFKNDMMNGQDQMIKILTRLDDERIFTVEWVKKIEKDVEQQREEINRIKLQLKVA